MPNRAGVATQPLAPFTCKFPPCVERNLASRARRGAIVGSCQKPKWLWYECCTCNLKFLVISTCRWLGVPLGERGMGNASPLGRQQKYPYLSTNACTEHTPDWKHT